MLSLVLALSAVQDKSPRDEIVGVLDGYTKRASVSLRIDRDGTSADYPGRFEQRLRWKAGGRFELVVTKPSGFEPAVGIRGALAPDIYHDGERTLQVWPSGLRTLMPLFPEDRFPIWEETGDLLMTWLMGSPGKAFWSASDDNARLKYSRIGETEWRGQKAIEFNATLPTGTGDVIVRMFVSASMDTYLGSEYEVDGREAWVTYLDQEFDVAMPDDLGVGPKRPGSDE